MSYVVMPSAEVSKLCEQTIAYWKDAQAKEHIRVANNLRKTRWIKLCEWIRCKPYTDKELIDDLHPMVRFSIVYYGDAPIATAERLLHATRYAHEIRISTKELRTIT